jgi:hypothetical protein
MSDANPFLTIQMTATAYCLARCLHVVARLGVADALDVGAVRPAGELAAKVGVDPDSLARVLRMLAANGIFTVEDDRVGHNDASRLLRDDHPRSLRAFVQMIGLDINWRVFGLLEQSVREGRPATAEVVPGGYWQHYAEHPEDAAIFNAAMTGKTHAQIEGILRSFDFTPYPRIGDIGGGRGHLLRAVLGAAPDSRGVLFDLAHVVTADAGPASERLQMQAGDFFHDPLPACDLYLLMEVIHDWPDAQALQILGAVRRAAPPAARVLVIEEVLSGQSGPEWARNLDVLMLGLLGGRQRTRPEYEALFAAAGWRHERAIHAVGGTTMLEAVAA